jgi:hypothetical protein
MTGKWKLKFTSPQGEEEVTADLVMEPDGTLTGTVSGQRGTGSLFSGWVSGDKFAFTINLLIEGNPNDVTFAGTFDGSSMKGAIQTMGYNFDFSGSKPTSAAGMRAGGAK